MTKTIKVTEKVRLAVIQLAELKKNPKGTSLEIINQLEKLGYQWNSDGKTWVNVKTQTTIMVKSDVTIIDELLEKILELIQTFDNADLELKNNPIIYQAKDKDGKPLDDMKQFYLVVQNKSLETDIDDSDQEVDVKSILNDDDK